MSISAEYREAFESVIAAVNQFDQHDGPLGAVASTLRAHATEGLRMIAADDRQEQDRSERERDHNEREQQEREKHWPKEKK